MPPKLLYASTISPISSTNSSQLFLSILASYLLFTILNFFSWHSNAVMYFLLQIAKRPTMPHSLSLVVIRGTTLVSTRSTIILSSPGCEASYVSEIDMACRTSMSRISVSMHSSPTFDPLSSTRRLIATCTSLH
ncbi:hypothetical protein ABW19_dt0204935 [Dactylella cylindrospora]|nr:hypothetical protein ABW19_dt0204935 [Dactylella cylindrospora]